MLYFIKVTVNRVSFKVTLGKTLFFMKKTGELFTIAGQGGEKYTFYSLFYPRKRSTLVFPGYTTGHRELIVSCLLFNLRALLLHH